MRSYTNLLIFSSILTLIYCCPTEPTDFQLLIKATYYLSDYQWEVVKNLVSKLSGAVNLGRTKETSQMAIHLFDNLNEPLNVVTLGSYGRSSDLSTAVKNLKMLPCGTWCAEETQKRDSEQVSAILSKLTFTRATKVFIITTEYIDIYSLQSIMSSPNVIIQQVIIPQSPGIVTYDQKYYNYYSAYYDNYKRYAGRMKQLYPYIHVEIPADQYPFIEQSNREENYDYDSWAASTCYSLIGCQECMTMATAPKISPSVDEEFEVESVNLNLNSGDSNSKSNSARIDVSQYTSDLETVSQKTVRPTTASEDYEYEITADPPGMKINKTPLLDEVNEKSVSDEDLI